MTYYHLLLILCFMYKVCDSRQNAQTPLSRSHVRLYQIIIVFQSRKNRELPPRVVVALRQRCSSCCMPWGSCAFPGTAPAREPPLSPPGRIFPRCPGWPVDGSHVSSRALPRMDDLLPGSFPGYLSISMLSCCARTLTCAKLGLELSLIWIGGHIRYAVYFLMLRVSSGKELAYIPDLQILLVLLICSLTYATWFSQYEVNY